MMLIDAPRGRSFLLEVALAGDDAALGGALFHACRAFEPPRSVSYYTACGGTSEPPSNVPEVTPAELAALLEQVPLVQPAFDVVRDIVARVVDDAAYWQPPSGQDRLLATPEMREALSRVEEHLDIPWFDTSFNADEQWEWWWREESSHAHVARPADRALRDWGEYTREEEVRLRRSRPFSGEWWSTPPFDVPLTTTLLPDGSPAGPYFVEDSFGWADARLRRVVVPAGVRVAEITGPQDWADLCRRFPLGVTHQKRYDWAECTGRKGRWLIPDFEEMAHHVDAVHLTVRGYLTTAGPAIPVDGEHASVLAGWAPENTYWLRNVAAGEELRDWSVSG